MEAVRVVIEREVVVGRGKRYEGPKTKWVRAWVGTVLYADRRFAVVRSVGAHQTFRGIPAGKRALKRTRPASWRDDGSVYPDFWGWSWEHPVVRRLALGTDRYGRRRGPGPIRLAPASVARLAGLIALAGFYARGGRGETPRPTGKKRSCRKPTSSRRRAR